jgi:hypothetical protein
MNYMEQGKPGACNGAPMDYLKVPGSVCAGVASGETCAFQCGNGFVKHGDIRCGDDGKPDWGGACVCPRGHYTLQIDAPEARTFCKHNSESLNQAGFAADARGSFVFTFSGQLPSDLLTGSVIVPKTAMLSLTGTGVETIGASFMMTGGELSVTSLNMARKSLLSTALEVPAIGRNRVTLALHLKDVTVAEAPELNTLSGSVTRNAGGPNVWQPPSLSAVAGNATECGQPHITRSDTWRATNNTGYGPWGRVMGDTFLGDPSWQCSSGSKYKATGVGGGSWYRFDGTGGDALPLTPPGIGHCGTNGPGWLSGWNVSHAGGGCSEEDGPTASLSSSGPPCDYSARGRYPAATDGVVEMVACFINYNDKNIYQSCYRNRKVGVARCEGFLLWQLPYAPDDCDYAYCTTPTELGGK